jgi:hypothetical protein
MEKKIRVFCKDALLQIFLPFDLHLDLGFLTKTNHIHEENIFILPKTETEYKYQVSNY